MLSRDCDGCSKLKECNKRFQKVVTGGKVHCPDGTAHLVDDSSIIVTSDICDQYLELFE